MVDTPKSHPILQVEAPRAPDDLAKDAGTPLWTGLWQHRLVQSDNRFIPLDAPETIDLLELFGGEHFFSNVWLQTHGVLPSTTDTTLDWTEIVAELALLAGSKLEVTVCNQDGKQNLGIGDIKTKTDVLNQIDEQLIVIRDAHREHPFIREWQQAFSHFFKCPVTTGLYLNGQGAPGFNEHHDAHHVFALQLSGRKTWWLGQPLVANTHRRYLWKEKEDSTNESIEMNRGQWLYLPPGLRHRAECSDDVSVHITFGVHTPHVVDAIEALFSQAGRFSPELRASLPMQVGPNGVQWGFPETVLNHLRPLLHPSIQDPLIVSDGTRIFLNPNSSFLHEAKTIRGEWPVKDGIFESVSLNTTHASAAHARHTAKRLITSVSSLESVYLRGSALEDETPETVFDLDLVLCFSQSPTPEDQQVLADIIRNENDTQYPFDVRTVLQHTLHDGSAAPYLRLCLAVRALCLAGQPIWDSPPTIAADKTLAQQLARESIQLWQQAVQHLYQQPTLHPNQRFPAEAVAWLQKRALRFTAFETLAVGAPFTRHPVGCVTLAQRYVPDLAPLTERVCKALLERNATNAAISDAIGLGTEWIRRMSN